jgi:hypothetical protein
VKCNHDEGFRDRDGRCTFKWFPEGWTSRVGDQPVLVCWKLRDAERAAFEAGFRAGRLPARASEDAIADALKRFTEGTR